VLERAVQLPANARERLHLVAIAAVLADDYERAKAHLSDVLRQEPRDVLALQVAHALDYVTGDIDRMGDRVSAVLPAWSSDRPGYHAVLAMHGFGLVESGHYQHASDVARRAIAINRFDARAHHVLAHVFDMTERFDAGIDWMSRHLDSWAVDTVVATHIWWHVALFHLAQGQLTHTLALYDRRVRGGHSLEIADLIDAAALLWRVELEGADVGARWSELAAAWAPHITDSFCTFNDLHAMLAFIGARDWTLARRLERHLGQRALLATRHGLTTRQVGLPACRGLIAFGRGDHALAIGLLGSLPTFAHRIGGSHLQRDVLHLTLSHAVRSFRRPKNVRRIAA